MDEYRERMILAQEYDAPLYYMESTLENLYPDRITDEDISYTMEYLEELKEFYSNTFRISMKEVDRIKNEFDREALLQLEREYSNKKLEEMVRNDKTFSYFTEYHGDMIQKRDPIFLDPTNRFIRAQFYAPRKMVAGSFVPTIWVNVSVIWFMTLLIYLLLYFRVLKRGLDHLERLFPHRSE